MPRISLFILCCCLCLSVGFAHSEEQSCSVRYLSAEHIYLDAGTTEGLVLGTKVNLVRGGKVFAELEVVYAAGHSASCVVVHQESKIVAGDSGRFEPVLLVSPEPQVTLNDSIPAPRTREVWTPTQKKSVADPLKFRGTVALQWDHSDDGADHNLQTDLISMPFRVRLERQGSSWSFRTKGSLRHISRNGFSASTAESEWRNRIREVAFLRQDSKLRWNFAFGRIVTRATASAGAVDGVTITRGMGHGLRLGAFTGFTPRWEDYGFSTDDRVSGMSLQLKQYSAGGNRLDMILAGVGRYHLGEVSREYMVLTSTWSNTSGLSLLQSSELDFNRKWRKDAAGVSTVELSSLALTGQYRLNRRFTFNLGYDDRQPVRTWETRALPDSLFQDAGRRGWRGGMTVRFAQGRNLNLRASIRSDERTGDDSKSWNGRLYLPNFPVEGFNTDASIRGFSGPWLSGLAPMLGVSKFTRSGLRLRLEGGYFDYSDQVWDESRSNSWLKFLISKDLSRHWSLAADYRLDWGGDMAGQRWFLEMRHRF